MVHLVPRALWLSLILLAAPALGQPQASPPLEPAPFVIGLEDELEIRVWQEPELSLSVTVRPDGKITVPLVGDVAALGRTPTELGKEVSASLGRFVKDPVVTVIVKKINHYKVYVLGEVGAQGELQLSRPTRLLQALAQAGGLSQYADKSAITVLRYEGEKEVRIRVDYRKIFNGSDPESNVILLPGDTILVK